MHCIDIKPTDLDYMFCATARGERRSTSTSRFTCFFASAVPNPTPRLSTDIAELLCRADGNCTVLLGRSVVCTAFTLLVTAITCLHALRRSWWVRSTNLILFGVATGIAQNPDGRDLSGSNGFAQRNVLRISALRRAVQILPYTNKLS